MNDSRHLTEAELNDTYKKAANSLKAGYPKWKLELELAEQGIDANSIRTIMDRLEHIQNSIISQSHKKAALRPIIIGLVILTIGIAITFITYQSARGGGTYIITYGAIIAGIFELVRGIVEYFDIHIA